MSICDVYYSNHDHSALVASYNKVERSISHLGKWLLA